MKILLRDISGRFYAGSGKWVVELASAKEFRLIEDAIRCDTEHHLGAAEVVLVYDSPACTLVLPLSTYSSFAGPGASAPGQSRASA